MKPAKVKNNLPRLFSQNIFSVAFAFTMEFVHNVLRMRTLCYSTLGAFVVYCSDYGFLKNANLFRMI